jgi:hypothetical protein
MVVCGMAIETTLTHESTLAMADARLAVPLHLSPSLLTACFSLPETNAAAAPAIQCHVVHQKVVPDWHVRDLFLLLLVSLRLVRLSLPFRSLLFPLLGLCGTCFLISPVLRSAAIELLLPHDYARLLYHGEVAPHHLVQVRTLGKELVLVDTVCVCCDMTSKWIALLVRYQSIYTSK